MIQVTYYRALSICSQFPLKIKSMIVLKTFLLIVILNVVTVNVLGNTNVAQDLLKLEERFNKKFEHYENEIRSLRNTVKEQASLLASCINHDTKTSDGITTTTGLSNSNNSTGGQNMSPRRELTRKHILFVIYCTSLIILV